MKRLILLTALFVFAMVGSAMAVDTDTVNVTTEVDAIYTLTMVGNVSFTADAPATGYEFEQDATDIQAATNDSTWKITMQLTTDNLPANSALYAHTAKTAGNSAGTGFLACTNTVVDLVTGTAVGSDVIDGVDIDWLYTYSWSTAPTTSPHPVSTVTFQLVSQ